MSSKTATIFNGELEEYITEYCQRGPWEIHSILPAVTQIWKYYEGGHYRERHTVTQWQVILTANISKGVGPFET